ncbi:hypothetical protein R3W88_026969 [Solanum pinnatisectum]|uniref:DUF1985 domain-containing protein n=1 Tax=Solanum pinnatisectum TaxID=50273 RepID=A0AAV9LI54_9SOLN|nr:hypothetical protein R3W88_026969 [Solanum pinnatisectum]
MFIVKINGTVLRFGIKEFGAVTGLKCGLLTDFVSDLSIPNRLIQKYFGEMTKVPKLDFLNKFKEANLFEPEDSFKIGVLYFISTFLTGSKYVNFPWGNECFRLTLKACSHRLGKNPTSFKFSQFHLALQIWFYECCHPFDNTVAICVASDTPRILNWKTSNEEMNAIDHNNLHESSSHNETENQETLDKNDVDFDEKYVELKKEIVEVREELKELKDNDDAHQHVEESEKAAMDQPSVSMREYVDISKTDAEAQNSICQTVGGVDHAVIPGSSTSKPLTLDDYPDLAMTYMVEIDPILYANTTPYVQPRNRNPGKYDRSSLRRVPIFCRIKHPFESHNGFEVADELIDEFNKWIFKIASSRRGGYMFSKMDFFNIMIKPGRPWEDRVSNIYQLFK